MRHDVPAHGMQALRSGIQLGIFVTAVLRHEWRCIAIGNERGSGTTGSLSRRCIRPRDWSSITWSSTMLATAVILITLIRDSPTGRVRMPDSSMLPSHGPRGAWPLLIAWAGRRGTDWGSPDSSRRLWPLSRDSSSRFHKAGLSIWSFRVAYRFFFMVMFHWVCLDTVSKSVSDK